MTDPFVTEIRDQIASTDRSLVTAINERLELVRTLWRYKLEHGVPLVDSDREESMLRHLTEANPGPLSAEGLADFYAHVVELTKRETARAEAIT